MTSALPLDGPLSRLGARAYALRCAWRELPAARRRDALFVALLAAVETMARTNRRLPIRAENRLGAAESGVLAHWPEAVRHCSAERARAALAPHLEASAAAPAGPHLALALTGEHDPGPAGERRAAVRLTCRVADDALAVELDCDEDDPWRRMQRPLAEIFAELLHELLVDPAACASAARGIGAGSRAAVLGELAGSAREGGPFRAIPRLIEANAALHPDRPAYAYGGQTLTYGEFDRLANGFAAALAARGIGKGDVVPVVLDNGLELPVAYHALMKLGAAFVPFDSAWPPERTKAALGILAPGTIVCADAAALPEAYQERGLPLALNGLAPRARRPDVELDGADPIYGIFTSGTTGTPKCALNLHAGLANRFAFMTRYFGAGGDEVVLQNSKHTFDSSVWQLFWPLTFGGRTVIPAQGEFLNLDTTIDTIAAHGITMTDFVPSIFNVMVSIAERDPSALRKLASLRRLIVGGEEMNPQMVHKLRMLLPQIRVTNGYGPTEASIGMVFHTVEPADGEAIPLGRPIDNCCAVVLDDEGRLLPPGAVGEIVIGGVCLGSGYFADPGRTAAAFVANPFPELPGERLYRTGDLGYFGPDGKLYFLGRSDFQVKVGGVRIELGELEAAAESCPHVRTAKVVVTQADGEKVLAVFAAGDERLAESALREHMRALLPRTSLPRHYVVLAEMPLSDNGKVDRRALQSMLNRKLADAALSLAAAEPAGRELDRVLHVFRSVLREAAFGAEDDFLDAGGDSIQALAVVQRLHTALGVRLGAQDLFENPTPLAMSRLIEDKRSGADVEAEDDPVLMARDAVVPGSIAIEPAALDGRLETVLVTGATGFVGSRIVHELLRRTALRVICLSRARDDAGALRRVVGALAEKGLWEARFADRLEAFAGDLARERLGLAAPVWDGLARECDLLVHNGALVNFLFDYRAHRAPNVLSTHEMLRLALAARPKPLHYVSTLGVLDCEAAHRTEPLPEAFDPSYAVTPNSGYSRSKWVAERCLLDARHKGALVTVFRLGEVMPSADNGLPNPHALTHLLLTAFGRLGVCPAVPLRTDYTPVDQAAARVVAGVTDRAAWGRTLHVFHPRSIALADVLAGPGGPPASVGCGEFLSRLERAADATADPELLRLRALLPHGADEAVLEAQFARLLTDNPRLFRADACRELERRGGLPDEPLDDALRAYRAHLAASG